MKSDSYADLAQLLYKLSEPLAAKQSGTFFIATDDNTSCRFAIKDGEITHCCYKRFHGLEAIQAIQAGLRGRSAFSENNNSVFRDSDKVEHQEVVRQLGLKFSELEEANETPTDDPPAPEAPKYLKKTYRGQEVITKAPTATSSQNTKKKPPRMYRGQVLDD